VFNIIAIAEYMGTATLRRSENPTAKN